MARPAQNIIEFCHPNNSGRYNKSNQALFHCSDLGSSFGQSAFRWVSRGLYTTGERMGQVCVCKGLKRGPVFIEYSFSLDLQVVHKAREFVHSFNQLGLIPQQLRVNVPDVWTFEPGMLVAFGDDAARAWVGQKFLAEPWIDGYRKFNSNNGWVNPSPPHAWSLVMQTLSHFTYHVSGGYYLPCDIQGGIYEDEVVLSDPAILSRTREYGVTDLDPEGIDRFFRRHVCNDLCHEWLLSRRETRRFTQIPAPA
ncbi:putative elongation factor 2 kinase [Lasiosphaeria ovina]|uniref:Elongation factor 2 kinase n=1 Tax=Lasiosphaeria ovina TaxID=92902 RepID=A0AAE0KG02_9PEZI|nr:putative elongation factor 2 kinase [Lasiosphaeria ovina]